MQSAHTPNLLAQVCVGGVSVCVYHGGMMAECASEGLHSSQHRVDRLACQRLRPHRYVSVSAVLWLLCFCSTVCASGLHPAVQNVHPLLMRARVCVCVCVCVEPTLR